jgi:hypothetical protein
MPATKIEKPLSIKERAFVDHYLALGGCKGVGKKAAELAGFTSWATFAAHRMLRRPRVMRAIEEETKRLVRALGPEAIRVIKEVLENREHKDRLKAARMVVEKIDPTFVQHAHDHTVEHTYNVKQLEELARRLAGELGIPPEKFLGVNGGPPLLEGEVVEAEPEAEHESDDDGDDDAPDWDD